MNKSRDEFKVDPPSSSQIHRAHLFLKSLGKNLNTDGALGYRRRLHQALTDIATIDKVLEIGGNPQSTFDISHLASFNMKNAAERYVRLLKASRYEVEPMEYQAVDKKYEVKFHHQGTVAVDDIGLHTMELDIAAESLLGYYDGWEIVID